jgi:predicted nucleic acid-binding protein
VILDTNGLSAIADGDSKLESIVREAVELAVPVIVLGEFRYGIRQSRARMRYEHWLTESLPAYRVLLINEETAEHYADIRDHLKGKGRPIPANDVWIAALTRQHDLPLLSRDQHFDFVPDLKRIGW